MEGIMENVSSSIRPLGEIVWDIIKVSGPMTVEQIGKEFNLRYTTVSARVSELKREKRVKVVGYSKTTSGCRAALLEVVKPDEI